MQCDANAMYMAAARCVCGYSSVLIASRLLSPLFFPKTMAKLDLEKGQRGYWDSCVAAFINGIVNTILVLQVWSREPRLFWGTPDPYLKNDDSCALVAIFMAWVAFDLAQVLVYWPLWDGRHGMLVHHGCAFLAWALYVEGGYGHALSLVGVFCEATNPCMNMRARRAATDLLFISLPPPTGPLRFFPRARARSVLTCARLRASSTQATSSTSPGTRPPPPTWPTACSSA